MGGGLMQLVAYGAQDIYLTGNPQITFFKVVYRRHTNFSMEAIEQTFDGTINYGSRVSCTISRNGDLIHKMYIQYVPNDIVNDSDTPTPEGIVFPKLGCGLLKEVELEIGGQRIDRHYSHWLSAREDLFEKNEIAEFHRITSQFFNTGASGTKYQIMTGNNAGTDDPTYYDSWVGKSECYMPLQFWFCRNVGLALPLIALQYHEVKLYWTLPDSSESLGSGTAMMSSPSLNNMKLFVDYIYLDTDERRRFAQVSHEYLIEQLQYEEHASSSSLTLNFNHPVKELIWGGVPSQHPDDLNKVLGASSEAGNSNGSVSLAGQTSIHTGFQRLDGDVSRGGSTSRGSDFNITLKLNGHERFSARPQTYFSRQQVNDYHTGFGCLNDLDGLCVYSFALKPEEHQPSGTCNFSRIDNAVLEFSRKPQTSATYFAANPSTSIQTIRVYAINYNVLRIMSGMGGLAYSN